MGEETRAVTPEWTVEPLDLARDLDGVMAVDAASFTNPWTREMFVWEAEHSDVSHVFVLRLQGAIVGYCALWMIFDELHINNLAVLPAFRNRGAGGALVEHALSFGAGHGAGRATLEVRRANDPARRLYERFGFTVTGMRPAYYRNPLDDALILWREERTSLTR